MVHALVTSKLDYCNSLVYGLPDILLNKLWNVQKSAARLITMSGKYQHISPTMKKLHWLLIRQCIEYKVLLLIYKALNNLAPVYLSDLLQCRVDWGSRRDNTLLLVDPKINKVTFGGKKQYPTRNVTSSWLFSSLSLSLAEPYHVVGQKLPNTKHGDTGVD